MTGLDGLLRPRHVALVGASPGARGNTWTGPARLTRRLARLTDVEVTLVNPGRTEILGRPAVPSLAAIGRPVDLAVLSVSADRLLPVLADLERSAVAACVVHTAHVAPEAKAEMRRIRDATGTRFLGPNSAGIMLAAGRVDSMPGATGVEPLFGVDGVSVVSQSGGFCTESALLLRQLGVPVRQVVSTGDEVDLTVEEIAIALLAARPAPRALLLFMESSRSPAQLGVVLRSARALRVPVGILKVGRSAASAAAALSHTGALVGEWDVFAAAATRDGAVVGDTVDDLLGLAVAAHSGLLGRPVGRAVALATNSGGLGGLSADHLSASGLTLPPYAPATLAALTAHAPGHGSWNPVDFADVPGLALPDHLAAVTADPGVDVAVVEVRGGIPYSSDVEELRVVGACAAKPVLVVWPGLEPAQRAVLIASGVATFDRADQLWRTLAAAVAWQEAAGEAGTGPEPLDVAQSVGATPVSYAEARDLAATVGLAQPAYVTLPPGWPEGTTAGPVIGSAIRPPVAVKVSAAAVVHKADAGGVRLGVTTDAQLRAHVTDIRARLGDVAVTVEEMIDPGVEVLVAARRTEFGVLLAIGWGGSLTEAAGDVVDVMLPATDETIVRAVRTTRIWRALARGGDAGPAEKAVLQMAHRVVDVLRSAPDIAVVEINPAIVTEAGAVAADVRVLRFGGGQHTEAGEGER